MISPSTAALVISVARGLMKLGQRLDALLAEKAAIQGGLATVMPKVYAGPSAKRKVRELNQYLAEWEAATTLDLLGDNRADLVRELKQEEPDNELVGECYRLVFPDRLAVVPLDPDAAYVEELRRRFPSFDLSDPDHLAVAFHLPAGKDDRQVGYGARIGLLVADVMAEFGAEHAGIFVRDPGARGVVQTVLERFANPGLEDFNAWSPLLRHALSATFEGLLDARAALMTDRPWLIGLMDVLANAREDPAGGDGFVLGLFQGRGYRLLLSKGLGRAAEALAEDQADAFKQLAVDVLGSAAPLVGSSPRFKGFFFDHWGDLLRAGLSGLERHGPALMENKPELLRDVLVGMVKELKEIPQANVLGHETLYRVGDAAIAAIVARPELIEARVGNEPWLRALLKSFVNTVARDGLRSSFSREGLDEIVMDAAGVFAMHPELITDAANAGLAREVVGGILRAVSELPSLDARGIATSAAAGSLRAIAAHPPLVDTRYAKLIADLTEQLAEQVQARTLTGSDAAAIVVGAAETLLKNPAFFDQARSNLAIATLNAVLQAAQGDPAKLLVGETLVSTVREVLGAVARFGKRRLGTVRLDEAVDCLAEVIEDALRQVAAELGLRLDLAGVPTVIGGMVGAWARGDMAKIEPESPAFVDLFSRLLTVANAD